MQWLIGLLLSSLWQSLFKFIQDKIVELRAFYAKREAIKREETVKAGKDTKKLQEVQNSDDGKKVDEAIDDATTHF